MRDLERALLDIAEVRDRLGESQRFKGYSAIASAASGCFALAAGAVQAVVVANPTSANDMRLYFAIWLTCCAASLIVNYGAIAHWFASDASARERWQTRTVGLALLPALVLGAVLSFALFEANVVRLLPGVWFGCYGVGLIASRAMIPRGALPIAAAFLLVGGALLFVPAPIALTWWMVSIGFGAGQLGIGYLIYAEREKKA